MPTVSALTYYPVKGCAGVSVPAMDIMPAGPAHDRAFMVVRAEDGLFRSQRTTPSLAVVRPTLVHDGTKLTLAAPGREDLAVDVLPDGPRRTVDVHGVWQGDAVDQGDDAAAWLGDLVGEPLRLVRVPPDHARMVDERHGPVTFTDSTALHLTSLASLDDLNARILDRGAEPVPMARFRPNVVVAGLAPYAEDDVRVIEAGGLRMCWVKPDVRCKVTMVDQETGERAGPEPLRTLATFRREPEGGVSFGIKLRVESPGRLAVGDELSWS
ncbi:MAG TPA: MOSC N-terminal beta barrel domain-containing protein [Actinophytocola sp.]|nr:MOSC N-terminal beta barrel domain-containing protein [Actinophytocola sp.]